MKTLADGTEVVARTYYYLLDWNEFDGWEFITWSFKKTRLCDLTIAEYKKLFEHATNSDNKKLIK